MNNSVRWSQELKASLNQLIGLQCWSVVAGTGTGSMVSLDFGDRVPRDRPVRNPHLTDEQRNYNGEFDLFISHCAWRIDSATEVICSSMDNNRNNGPMVSGLRQLIGSKVSSVELLAPAHDLIVIFQNSLTLKLFCHIANTNEDYDNYTFFTPRSIFIVGAKGQIEAEPSTECQDSPPRSEK